MENFLKGYLKNYTEKEIITKTVDELVMGGYEPEIFNKVRPLAKLTGIEIPDKFEILLGVSTLQFISMAKIKRLKL